MPSQPEAQGDILKEFREGTFLSSLDTAIRRVLTSAVSVDKDCHSTARYAMSSQNVPRQVL